MTKCILILGGTTEAFQIAQRLAAMPDLTVITSLAGRVAQPKLPPGEVRIGGFGGVAGLTSYLLLESISVVIDATHPYAAKISRNAELACNSLTIPLIAYERPAWKQKPEDNWRHVSDSEAAAALVDREGTRVFLSIGRQELGSFSNCRQAYFLIRAIEPPEVPLPPNSELLLARGPFALAAECEMLRAHSINWMVSKNSGGSATYPKIEAARELHIAIAMIDRPAKHGIDTDSDMDELFETIQYTLDRMGPS